MVKPYRVRLQLGNVKANKAAYILIFRSLPGEISEMQGAFVAGKCRLVRHLGKRRVGMANAGQIL